MEQKPSVGRIVHFKDAKNKEECIAAIITKVNRDGTIVLTTFEPFKNAHVFAVVEHETSDNPLSKAIGTWHWPERV